MLADTMAELLFVVQTTKYLHVSSTALLLFDWFLTLDAEVKYAWRACWNWGRALFFLTRYPTFIVTGINLYYEFGSSIQVSTCCALYISIEMMSYSGTLFAEAILTMRVWALWRRRIDVGAFLIIMFIGCSLLGAVGHHFSTMPNTVVPLDSIAPAFRGCSPAQNSTELGWATIALLIYTNVIFAMTMAAGFHHYREGAYRDSSLIYTFYKDGILYYAALLGFSVGYIIMIQTKHWVVSPTFLLSIQRVINSILSSRMVLHIYEEMAPSQETEDAKTSIRFAGMGTSGLVCV
ncbi:hypothetical protein BDZ94DRAFT_1254100 [Collybia nuda]|uniref:DUF6533 domain-containing protein n=1 Tax=Collybia nuda TaxID=64659 RepID=A0A9P5Y9Q0_9AGAR|nr:hypothetical protein BDZ94DRAFT_1254100 [Collybia nuda]